MKLKTLSAGGGRARSLRVKCLIHNSTGDELLHPPGALSLVPSLTLSNSTYPIRMSDIQLMGGCVCSPATNTQRGQQLLVSD